MTRPAPTLPPPNIDLRHTSIPSGRSDALMALFTVLLVAGLGFAALTVAFGGPTPRPYCPDGYVVSHPFGDTTHCVPGVAPEWR